MEQQPLQFYEDVRAGYLKLAAAHSDRVRLVDASRPVAEVGEDIHRHLWETFHGFFPGSGI